MRLDKFTLKVQEALQVAQRRAETLKSAQLEPEHLLEALAWQEDGIVAPLLKKLGVSIDSLRSELDRHFSSQPKVDGRQLSLSPRLDAIFRRPKKRPTSSKMNMSRPSTFCWLSPLRTVWPANSCAGRGQTKTTSSKPLLRSGAASG